MKRPVQGAAVPVTQCQAPSDESSATQDAATKAHIIESMAVAGDSEMLRLLLAQETDPELQSRRNRQKEHAQGHEHDDHRL